MDYAKGTVLLIPKAVYADSGQYCCSVSNSHGSRLSNSVDIQVTRVKGQLAELCVRCGGGQNESNLTG